MARLTGMYSDCYRLEMAYFDVSSSNKELIIVIHSYPQAVASYDTHREGWGSLNHSVNIAGKINT